MSDRKKGPALIVSIGGLAIGVAIALRVLIPNEMDPTVYVAFSWKDSPAQIAYTGRIMGRPVVAYGPAHHDGKYFFAQANDPWYLEPERHAAFLDAPLYRAQRMLYPTIASAFGLLPPRAVVWSLVVTNIIFITIGAGLASRLAARWGHSPWLGLWVPLNIGLMLDLSLGTAGVVAYTCCLAAILALETERTWLASLLFAAAALAREEMLLFAVGIFALRWMDRRETPWSFVVTPVVAMGVWHVYLRLRLNGIQGAGEVDVRPLSPPFVGLFQAVRVWLTNPSYLVLNVTIVAIVAAFVLLAVRSRSPIVWGALPFAGLAAVLSVQVWSGTYDFPRAFAPVFTAIPFLISASLQEGRGDRISRMVARESPSGDRGVSARRRGAEIDVHAQTAGRGTSTAPEQE